MRDAEGDSGSPLLLCLHGSPRAGGNTDILLEHVARGARDAGVRVEHLHCRKLRIRGCTGCGACSESGECALRDGMDRVYAAVDNADALVVGAPVYFLGVPAQFKTLIDRFQCRWARRYLLDRELPRARPGALLATAGAPSPAVFTCPQRTVDAFFEVLAIERRSTLLYEKMDEKGAVRTNTRALAEAEALGASLAAAVHA
ncbi:MAG: flavodoxin family protein, partial [Proteobacteria bacterium]|nr:flavodoxin family protein [Pseudomonadota bacterium]